MGRCEVRGEEERRGETQGRGDAFLGGLGLGLGMCGERKGRRVRVGRSFGAWLTDGMDGYLNGIGFIRRACTPLPPYVGPTDVGNVRVSVNHG